MTVTDVNNERARLDELRQEKELLQRVFDSAPVLIAAVDASGVTLRLANSEWERLLGWTSAELRGQAVWRRLFPERITRESARAWLRDATGHWEEFPVATRSGATVRLCCAVGRLSEDSRLIVAQDVTEQRRSEELVQERQESLRRVAGVNTVSEMAAAISHEVNQPLTALINYATGAAYHLRSLPNVPREAMEAVEKAIVEAHRSAAIVQRIRGLVQKRRIEQTSLDVGGLIRQLASVLFIEAARAKTALQVACEPNLPAVPADRIQIEQVIANLVRNAIEAMETRVHPRREVIVCAQRAEGSAIQVSVMDHGCGLSKVKERLFTPFFTTKPFGTGIGLSLCLSIVEAHGGRLWADDNPEGGAIFRFTLPLYDPGRSALRPQQATALTDTAAPSPPTHEEPPSAANADARVDEMPADLISSSK